MTKQRMSNKAREYGINVLGIAVLLIVFAILFLIFLYLQRIIR